MTFADSLFLAVKNTSIAEWIGFATAIAYVWLAALRSIYCWIFGIISSGVYIFLAYKGKIYLDAGLQFFYVIMGVYGWINWNNTKIDLKIKTEGLKFHLVAILLTIAISPALGYFFDRFTDQESPYLDATITAFSFLATFMTAKKILENWLYWIVIDFAAIFLFASRGYVLTSLLYALFTVLAFYAWLAWRKQYRAEQNSFQNLH